MFVGSLDELRSSVIYDFPEASSLYLSCDLCRSKIESPQDKLAHCKSCVFDLCEKCLGSHPESTPKMSCGSCGSSFVSVKIDGVSCVSCSKPGTMALSCGSCKKSGMCESCLERELRYQEEPEVHEMMGKRAPDPIRDSGFRQNKWRSIIENAKVTREALQKEKVRRGILEVVRGLLPEQSRPKEIISQLPDTKNLTCSEIHLIVTIGSLYGAKRGKGCVAQ